MIPLRSFRVQLALRISWVVMLLALVGSGVGYLAVRRILYGRLDATLVRLAGIEAAATTDSPGDSVHFHEEVVIGRDLGEEMSLPRYAEVWTLDGEPVIRTSNLNTRDLSLPEPVRARVATTGKPELFDLDWDGQSYRSVLYPLGRIGPQHRVHLLQVAVSTSQTASVLRNIVVMLVGLVAIGSAAGGGLGWWIAGRAVRPVVEIIQQAETLEAGRPSHHIATSADIDELSRLVSVLNAMLARLDATFDDQRRFLADAGHAIKTPLTVLRGDVDVALRKPRSREEYEAVLRQTGDDLRKVSGLAEDLIMLARSDSGALAPDRQGVPVRSLLTAVADRFESLARDTGSELTVDASLSLVVQGDLTLLDRAVSNLVDNAIRYGGAGRRIVLAGGAQSDGSVRLRVTDDGPGITRVEQARVFERFYRGQHGKRTALGSGLGLPIVAAIIESLGGTVSVQSTPGRGTTVTLECPGDNDRRDDLITNADTM